jgi:hypothetical protein
MFHVLMGHAYSAVISHSLSHAAISFEPSVPFWPPLLAEHCRTSHINTCIAIVFLPLLGFCISHKGPINLLNIVVPAKMISVIVEFYHVLGSTCSLSFSRRTQKWRLHGLFSPLLYASGVWSQVDLLVFQMALGHQQALCKCWFGLATVCDILPWNGSCDANSDRFPVTV